MFIKAQKGDQLKVEYKTGHGNICPTFVADTPLAKRFSGLAQIIHDINHAKDLMTLCTQIENKDVLYSLWMSAIVTYGKCFASAKGRKIKLEDKHVEKFNSEAIHLHKSLLRLRNEYFAHAGDNGNEVSIVTIIMSPEVESREVLNAGHTVMKKYHPTKEDIAYFCALCDGLNNVIQDMAGQAQSLVIAEYKKMDVEELYHRTK